MRFFWPLALHDFGFLVLLGFGLVFSHSWELVKLGVASKYWNIRLETGRSLASDVCVILPTLITVGHSHQPFTQRFGNPIFTSPKCAEPSRTDTCRVCMGCAGLP